MHNTEQLAVGILDTGSLEQLTSCLDWYTSEMNFSLHVVTQEGRFDLTSMQEAYKDVTFLVFTSHTFTGEKVNAVANECRTNLFLIVRSDLLLVKFDGPACWTQWRKATIRLRLPLLLPMPIGKSSRVGGCRDWSNVNWIPIPVFPVWRRV